MPSPGHCYPGFWRISSTVFFPVSRNILDLGPVFFVGILFVLPIALLFGCLSGNVLLV